MHCFLMHQGLGRDTRQWGRLQRGHRARTTWYYGGVATGPAGRDTTWRDDLELHWMPVLQTSLAGGLVGPYSKKKWVFFLSPENEENEE